MPKEANAGFFDSVSSFIFGNGAQASDSLPVKQGDVDNSKDFPLLGSESSVNPNKKDVDTSSKTAIVEGEALSSDNLQGTDSDINSYMSSDKITTYTVKKGDTLDSVASDFSILKSTILYANTNIKNNTLKAGQVLIILPVDGVSYTIKKGDTISSIAKAYKAQANDIANYNDISDKTLKIGDKIIVPGGVAKKVEAVPSTPKVDKKETNTENKPESKVEKQLQTAVTQEISSGKGITGGYIWPFPSGTGRVSQRLHDDNAYDFAAPKGTPIYAIQDGTVLIADGSGYNGGYGLYVVIDFNDGGQAIFGHMSKVSTTNGEVVKKGDIIGYVGSTGRSTGNHVHIGYRGGKSNPYRNLPLNSGL